MSARAILIGHVGRDPEIFTFDDGGRSARFSLATDRTWTGRDNERHAATEWHDIEIRSKSLIEGVLPYIRKGRLLHVEGDIESSHSETAGVRRKHTKVILRSGRGIVTLLGPRPDQDDADDEAGEASPPEVEASAPTAESIGGRTEEAPADETPAAETAVQTPWRDPDQYPIEIDAIDIDGPATAEAPAASPPSAPADSPAAEPGIQAGPASPPPETPEPAPAPVSAPAPGPAAPLPEAAPRQPILAAGQGVS